MNKDKSDHKRSNVNAKKESNESTHSFSMAVNWMASLMFVQFLSRILHFGMNLLIVRYMSPEDYGISALQLPFVATVIPRLIREALHRAAVRKSDDYDQILVLVWWSIPIGAILSGLIGLMFLMNSSTIIANPWAIQGFWCWMISSWMEMAIEPIIIYAESNLIMKLIVVVECISLFVQILGTMLMVYTMNSFVLLQSYGQLLFTASLTIGYYGYAFIWIGFHNLFPHSKTVSSKVFSSLKTFLLQSLGKYVTAEGEHFILFFFGTPEQQGIYEFVHNLGSMVARIAFQSIERTGFVYFAKLSNQTQERRNVWIMLLNVSYMISFLYLSTCPPYIYFLINTIYGDKWRTSNAPTLLALYGIYLLLIGVNGLVEAHRDAVSSYTKLQQMSYFTIFSVTLHFTIGSVFMYYFGAAGLILAACISTIVRCTYNITFFKEYMFSIMDGLPPKDALITFATIFVSAMISRSYLGDTWKHFIFGIAQGFLFVVWLAFFQRRKLLETWKLIKSKSE